MEKPTIGIGAHFSPDNVYRFALWRIWDTRKPLAMFIGLNPSRATQRKDDRTIGRLNGRDGLAATNGFGGFYMMNLYPFITPYPRVLERSKEQLPENDLFLQQVNLYCETVVFCWGAFKTFGRAEEVIKMFPAAMCFGYNQDGSPKHPLYLNGETKLKKF